MKHYILHIEKRPGHTFTLESIDIILMIVIWLWLLPTLPHHSSPLCFETFFFVCLSTGQVWLMWFVCITQGCNQKSLSSFPFLHNRRLSRHWMHFCIKWKLDLLSSSRFKIWVKIRVKILIKNPKSYDKIDCVLLLLCTMWFLTISSGKLRERANLII